MPSPLHLPLAPMEQREAEGHCKWCGRRLGKSATGRPFFDTLVCAWQFATEVVQRKHTIIESPIIGRYVGRRPE